MLGLVLVFLIHGYQPYSQDASIYVAGIEKKLNPSLFSIDRAFIEAHTRLSLFSGLMAVETKLLHVSLDTTLLLVQVASAFAFLFGCYVLALRVFSSKSSCWCATLLAASCFTMPAAATSILVMDPYASSRSISTPAGLFAIVCCLDRSWARMTALTLLAISMNPLMGLCLAGFLMLLVLVQKDWIKPALALCGSAFVGAGILSLLTRSTPISEAYRQAALSRSYYFLSGWEWYEIVGLVAPLGLMALVWTRPEASANARKLCMACLLVGCTSVLISLGFVRAAHPDLLMRLSVLRVFHTVYLVGLVLAGGYLGSRFGTSHRWVVAIVIVLAALCMFLGNRSSYPTSTALSRLTGGEASQMEQAFLWVRANTPHDAVFAVDPQFYAQQNRDSIGFRAMTERSILTDIKDEGVVSLFPPLAEEWERREDAQMGLNGISDGQREARLRPYGVHWLLLAPDAPTTNACPYRNAVVAVCRLNP